MYIKILQWNIWIHENIENILKEIQKTNADIVCVQEFNCFDDKPLKKVAEYFDYYYFEVAHKKISGRLQGNAIFSKYPIIDKKCFFVQEAITGHETDWSKEGRTYIECKIKINNYEINVGTTHLSYSDNVIETGRRDKEIDRLIECIKNKNKFIFAGDLNITPESKYIKKIEEHLEMCCNPKIMTWRTRLTLNEKPNNENMKWKIDYIFRSKDIKLVNCKTLSTEFSDHFPILAKFDIGELV